MSIIAGIHLLDPNASVMPERVDELRALISRQRDDAPAEFRKDSSVAFHLDLNAFGAGFHFDSDEGFSLISGEPLGPSGNLGRQSDLESIHDDIANGRIETLRRCRGTFCVASVQNDSLTLVGDKLGVRQMFVWVGSGIVVFSTALRIIEQLSFINLRLNIRGVVELAALGYPLGDRTPYENVFAIRAGEVLQFRPERTIRCRYWRWDQIEPSELPIDAQIDQLHDEFLTATRLRLKNDRTTIAYLSGGLDSRCVVAGLDSAGARIHTFNFALPGTQDLILGREFAEKIGSFHTEVPKQPGDHVPDYSAKIAESWQASAFRSEFPVETENLVWSGEGGSVALGHVHLGAGIVESMRGGRIESAIGQFFDREGINLSPKLFRNGIKRPMDVVRTGVRDELKGVAATDPARSFYLFLMLNDQRRKLHRHFENIDLHRTEFQLPFFDSDFFSLILRAPVDECLGHKLYNRWLDRFQPAVTEVAWQSYPGHEPCPLPVENSLAYQWDERYQTAQRRAIETRLTSDARELLRSDSFPKNVLSRRNLRVAFLIHRSGLRNYGYLIETARLVERYARNCD